MEKGITVNAVDPGPTNTGMDYRGAESSFSMEVSTR